MQHFVAFSAKDKTHADTIERAVVAASTAEVSYQPWSCQDGSSSPIDRAVSSWLDEADALVADITYVNSNVTYEIGYAIGASKDLRLIRNKMVDVKELKQVGLLDTLLHDQFKTCADLEKILRGKEAPRNKWSPSHANIRQPIYVLSPPSATDFTTKLFSVVKKRTHFKFRSFKAWEIGRLTAQDAWEQTSASFGVIVTWRDGGDMAALRNNQRASLIFGMARGLGVPALLIAHSASQLPADLHDQAVRFNSFQELDEMLTAFRDEVQEAINEREETSISSETLLGEIHCGDPAAENEQEHLKEYFLETEEFKQTLNFETNLVIGRKGSGKSAIFLQVRDRVRTNKKNIVIDLNPEGYQLLKLKEVISEIQSLGGRKEFVAAFWQYVLWLEISYKILEKDARAAERDSVLGQRYDRLKVAFQGRVDTGSGDFSERLRILTEMICCRYSQTPQRESILASSDVLQVVYGSDIASIRDEVLSYLKLKGEILFLFDNLDRMRAPTGFDETDGFLIAGLIESMQDISKQFRRKHFEFRWVLFIRSDVYEFVVRSIPDYGKHACQTLEWNDPDILKRILIRRIEASIADAAGCWENTWNAISVSTIKGENVFDFIVNSSLRRPRYMIRLFETAKRRAINLGQKQIREQDYLAALDDLGWTVIEDLNLELNDVVRNADLLLFDIAQLDGACGLQDLRDAIAFRVGATDAVNRVLDVLLWGGAIGIAPQKASVFIYDCGYKLQFLHSLIDLNPDAEVCLHPTIRNLFTKSNGDMSATA